MIEVSNPSEFRLPKADLKAIQDWVLSPIPRSREQLQDVGIKYSYTEILMRAVDKAIADQNKKAAYMSGIILTMWILNDSQSRTGGKIPEEINRDLVQSAWTSWRENDSDSTEDLLELFQEDPLLYFGMTIHSLKGEGTDLWWLLNGSLLLRKFLNNTLQSRGLDQQFPPTN